MNRYWDTNGAAGFGSIAGGWDGTNNFWNTSSTGATSGTFVATPTSADDLFISGGTTGTITVTGARFASSITLSAAVAKTISGGTSITIGGTGANSGLFSTASTSIISTPIILNSSSTAITYRNTSPGLFTIGRTTGSAISGTQTISVESTNGAITLNAIIEDGAAGGKVAVTYSVTAGGTVTGASTYTGGTQSYTDTTNVTAGRLNVTGTLGNTLLTVSNNATLGGEGSTAGNVILANGSTLLFDPTTTGANQYFRTTGTIDATAGGVKLQLSTPITSGTGIVIAEAASGSAGSTIANFALQAPGGLDLKTIIQPVPPTA